MPWKHLKAAEKWESCLKSNWAATAFTDKPVRSCCAALSRRMAAQSLFGNYEGACGEGFWPWPRRRVPSIPAAGCKERANAGHGQKTRRPEGFRAKGRLASLLLGHRPLAGMLPRRASPSGLLPENRPPANFKTGSAEKKRSGAMTLQKEVERFSERQLPRSALVPSSPHALMSFRVISVESFSSMARSSVEAGDKLPVPAF